MRAEAVLLLVGLAAAGCEYQLPADYGTGSTAIVSAPAHVTPYGDWEAKRNPNAGGRYNGGSGTQGDTIYEGTICFPFSASAAMCGGPGTVGVSRGETHSYEMNGSFTPPNVGITFRVSESGSHTSTVSLTYSSGECEACWAYVCYAARITPVTTRYGRGLRRSRTTYEMDLRSPSIRKFCQSAIQECNCDAGVADAGDPDASAEDGGADEADAGAGDAGGSDGG